MVPIFHGQNRRRFYPPSYNDLLLWINAESPLNYTLSGNSVITITDLSPRAQNPEYQSGYHAAVTSYNGGINNCFVFPDNSNYWFYNILSTASQFEVYVVGYRTSPNGVSSKNYFLWEPSAYAPSYKLKMGFEAHTAWDGNVVTDDLGTELYSANANPIFNNLGCLTYQITYLNNIYTFNKDKLYINNSEGIYSDRSAALSQDIKFGFLGSHSDSQNSSFPVNNYLAEILIYNRQLSTVERTQLYTDLHNKYIL